MVDIDPRPQHRVIFAHCIYHDLARLRADSCDFVEVALNHDGIVYREDEFGSRTSEVLIKASNSFAEHDSRTGLNGCVDQLIDCFICCRCGFRGKSPANPR